MNSSVPSTIRDFELLTPAMYPRKPGNSGNTQGEIKEIKTDYVLGFFGLIMQLGPILDWGLNINKKKYIIIYYQENDNNNLFSIMLSILILHLNNNPIFSSLSEYNILYTRLFKSLLNVHLISFNNS